MQKSNLSDCATHSAAKSDLIARESDRLPPRVINETAPGKILRTAFEYKCYLSRAFRMSLCTREYLSWVHHKRIEFIQKNVLDSKKRFENIIWNIVD